MKKIAILLTFGFAATCMLTACGKAAVAGTGTATETEHMQSAVQMQPDDDTPESGTTALSAQENVSDTRENTAPDGTGAATLTDKTAGRTQSVGSTGETAAQSQQKTDPNGKPAVSASSGAQTTKQSGLQTTKQSGTQTTKQGGAQTVSPGTTASSTPAPGTSSGGNAHSSGTKPSGTADATEPAGPTEGTTKPSTTKPVSSDAAVSGTLSYLNGATVTYLPALNADDLKGFGITGEEQKEILKNKKDWTAYTIQIDFRNNTDKPLTIYYLDVRDNGKDSIYVCGDTAGELGMTAGGRISEKFYVLAKKEMADIDVRDKLSHMEMHVQYAETPADDNMTPIFKDSKIG